MCSKRLVSGDELQTHQMCEAVDTKYTLLECKTLFVELLEIGKETGHWNPPHANYPPQVYKCSACSAGEDTHPRPGSVSP